MKKLLSLIRKKPLIIAALTIGLCYFSIMTLHAEEGSVLGLVLVRVLLTIVCASALYLISGAKTYESFGNRTGYVLKKFLGFLIFSGLMGLLYLGYSIYQHTPLIEHWPRELLYSILLVIFVGLFEEMCFRVIINDALIYRFRDQKSVFVWVAVISSLLFGWIHVAGASLSSPTAIAQAILKTLSCAIFGLALLILYWKTRNLWGIALAHAIYDALPLLPTLMFGGDLGNYVTDTSVEGALTTAYASIGVYTVQTVVELFFLLRLVKVLRSIDFDQLREEW